MDNRTIRLSDAIEALGKKRYFGKPYTDHEVSYNTAIEDAIAALSALPAVDEQAREWFHVVIIDDKTYGIKDWGGSMSFPWSEDRQDAWELKDAINRAVDFSFKHPTLVEPSQGHIPPPLPAPPIE